METRLALPADDRRIVDRVDRQEGHVVVAVEPPVELADTERKGGHRHTVEHPLGVVGHLAGLVQPHQAGGEHLGMDAEPAERPAGQLRRHDVRNGSDARLQRGPVVDVGQCVARNRRRRRRSSASRRGQRVRRRTRRARRSRRAGWCCRTWGAGSLVRGRCGLTSMMRSRSGSRPARSNSSRVPPTCRERFTAPCSSGGAACATITRGANRAMIGPICRKPPGTRSTR